jgi:hypothetical protein
LAIWAELIAFLGSNFGSQKYGRSLQTMSCSRAGIFKPKSANDASEEVLHPKMNCPQTTQVIRDSGIRQRRADQRRTATNFGPLTEAVKFASNPALFRPFFSWANQACQPGNRRLN